MGWGDEVDALLGEPAPKPHRGQPVRKVAPAPVAAAPAPAPPPPAPVVENSPQKELFLAAQTNPPPPAVPSVSGGQSFARGGLQGATSGWSDELAARIDQGVSKVPGLRDLADQLRAPGGPPISDPNVSYEARRDFYRGLNDRAQRANPKAYLGGVVAGGVAQQAIPIVGELPAAAGGALAGAGFSTANDVKGVTDDALRGAALAEGGKLLGQAGGAVVQKVVQAAPAAVMAGVEKTIGAMSRAKGSARLWAQRGRVMDAIKSDPELRAAIGNPTKIADVVARRTPIANEATDKIYAAADEAAAKEATAEARTAAEGAANMKADRLVAKGERARARAAKAGSPVGAVEEIAAKEAGKAGDEVGEADVLASVPIKEPKAVPGGIKPDEVTGALEKIRNRAVAESRDGAQARAIDKAIEDFKGGLGTRYARVPAAKIRAWLSDRLAPTRPLDRDSSEGEKAIAEAYDAVHTLLSDYVAKHLGEDAAKALQKQNDALTAYSVLSEVAQGALKRQAQNPGVQEALEHVAQSVPRTNMERAGEFVAGKRGVYTVRAAGAAADVATRAAASPTGQAVGRSAPALSTGAARVLAPATIEALTSGDEKRRREAVHREVYSK